jgi:hypothetical protein
MSEGDIFNECDSAHLYIRFNQFIQDYLVKNNIEDFTKYEFYMNNAMKPSFTRWEYSIDKPIFKKHDTHLKLTNMENKIDNLEKRLSDLSLITMQLKADYEKLLSQNSQLNTLSTLKELQANLSKVESNPSNIKRRSFTLPKPTSLTKIIPSPDLRNIKS